VATMTADATLRFVVREGFRLSDEDAEIIVEEFERLYAERGEVTATILLEAASRKGNPLHGYFEWDDGTAAHKFRLQQANYFCRSVAIVEVERRRFGRQTEDVVVERRALVSAQDEDGQQAYHPRKRVLERADLRASRIKQLWSAIYGYRDELSDFEEFEKFVEDMDRQNRRM